MTVSVTMIATRMGEDGDYWEAGTSHDATDGFARYLVQYGWASGTFPRAEQSAPVQFISITAAEVAAGNGVVYGFNFSWRRIIGRRCPTYHLCCKGWVQLYNV